MNFDEDRIMKEWDLWRNKIANGNKSSSPRDWFENLLDQWKEDVENAFKCNSQIKKEAGEQRLTKQSTPIFCPDCKSDQVNYKCGNCDYTFIKW